MENKTRLSLVKCYQEYPLKIELEKIRQSFNIVEQGKDYLKIINFFNFAILKDEKLKDELFKFVKLEGIDDFREENLILSNSFSELKKGVCQKRLFNFIQKNLSLIDIAKEIIFIIKSEGYLKNDNESDY